MACFVFRTVLCVFMAARVRLYRTQLYVGVYPCHLYEEGP